MLDKPAPFQWTDDILEKAKSLIASGYSAQQVCVQIGCPSRNILIGKMYRLGLAGGGQGANSGRRMPVEVKPAAAQPRVWTKELTQRAVDLFQTGRTHSEIADCLGMSKNSVSRYLQRIGLVTDRSASQRAVAQLRANRQTQDNPKPVRRIESKDADLALPESRRIKLIDMPMFGACRWPLGDPRNEDFCFCGADTGSPKLTYCPSHRELSTRAPSPSEAKAGKVVA